MSLISKIRFKFKNLIGFEKLNPLNSFEWDGDFKEFDCENNIDVFKEMINNHGQLKYIIWTAIYHCLNTYYSSNEFLTVLDVNLEIIADLLEGDEGHVEIPKDVKNQILDGNVLATFHNHFNGAIIPSSKDLENTIFQFVRYMVITSHGNIGIVINDNKSSEDNIRHKWMLFYSYINWSFYNDMAKEIQNLHKLDLSKEEKEKEEQVLFDKFISKNLSKFGKEFNSRMKKFNVYFLHISIKE